MSDMPSKSYRNALLGVSNQPVVFTTTSNQPVVFTTTSNPPNTRDAESACLRIMAKVQEFGLPLKLDSKTPADDSCFFWSVLQQLRRDEIYPKLGPDIRQLVDSYSARTMRQRICQFGLTSPAIKDIFAELDYPLKEYWNEMRRPDKWADEPTVRTTAIFLGIQISIVETLISTKDNPLLVYPCLLNRPEESSLQLFIGNDHDFHYQSLLPTESTNSTKIDSAGDKSTTATTSADVVNNNWPPLKAPVSKKSSKADPNKKSSAFVNKAGPKLVPDQENAKNSAHPSDAQPSGYKTMSLSLGMTSEVKADSEVPPVQQTSTSGHKTMSLSLGMTSEVKADSEVPPVQQASTSGHKTMSLSLGMTPEDQDFDGEDTNESDLPTKCPACNGDYPKLMAHLRNRVCKEKLGEVALNELRLKFQKQSIKKYNNSQKGSECRQKYEKTDKAAERQQKYEQTDKAAERHQKYEQTDKAAERQQKYEQTDKAVARHKKYEQTEEAAAKACKRKKASFENAREKNYKAVKVSQNAWKASERTKKRKAAEDKATLRISAVKKLKVVTEKDRLRNFQKATLTGPDFWCLSCNKGFFEHQVKLLTEELLGKIDDKLSRDSWVAKSDVYTRVNIEKESQRVPESYKMSPEFAEHRYICNNCHNNLITKGKMSHSCVMNNLQLHDTDQQLREQDMECTELEGALCAKALLFQKIVLLVKSRWTGLIDKIINIPVPDENINNLMAQFPRLPKDSGMVIAVLKRKLEYKNLHTKQLVNPDRMCRLLAKLVLSGNPHYTNVDTPEQYKARCATDDESGFDLLYGEDSDELLEALETIAQLPPDSEVNDEILADEKDEDDIEVRENHPLLKDQFIYDESVALTDKFPEISVAPGEGGTPKNLLTTKDLDIMAFPHLNNADGSNGLNAERPIRLTEQKYFIQRMLNIEKRFAKSPTYLYFAVHYLELKRIQSNISLIGTRGKKKMADTGAVSYELDDAFRVLESIPNTPGYWKDAKRKLIALMENHGPFQVRFDTVSLMDIL